MAASLRRGGVVSRSPTAEASFGAARHDGGDAVSRAGQLTGHGWKRESGSGGGISTEPN